jgi:TPR repeat protein
MYENGRGVEKDQKKAFEYCLKSAEAGDAWSQNRVGWYFANGSGVEKDYKKAFKWYRKAADKENSDAIGNVGWCYETGNGVAKDENEALKWYVQAAKKQNSWAEKRFMAMGDAAYWDKNYSMAAKCFEAAEKLGIKGAGEGLYRLDVQSRKLWEGADPRRGILAKRKAVKGQDSENSETARLAGELFSFGYPIEAGKMVQEAIENARWGTADEELAEWYTLAGFCCIADPQAEPDRLISGNPSWGSKWLRPEFAQVGLGMFNLKIGSPQLGLDVSYLSDFISPSEPRRWASLLMAQLEWGLKLWQEQSTGWYSRLARASVASNSKGIDYLWATQNLQNLGKAKEDFEKATKLFSNLSAWAGLAMIARQEGDTLGQEKAIEEMKNILTENAIVDTAKLPKIAKGKAGEKKPEDIAKEIAEKGKARRNKTFEGLIKNGQLPWGNEKGELTFGFGYGSGSGLFHGGLLTIGAQLFIPLFLYVKPDWLMLACDMCMRSGDLSPYQLTPLYEQLTKRPSTRIRAISRLVQIHCYLENKEEALRWALLAAEENPQDLVTLQTAVRVAQWAGESEKAHAFSVKIVKEEERARSKTDDSPQNMYLQIYAEIQEADRHLQAREVGKARHLYENALGGLEEIGEKYPDWEPTIIRYRIKYLEEKLSEIDQVEEKK